VVGKLNFASVFEASAPFATANDGQLCVARKVGDVIVYAFLASPNNEPFLESVAPPTTKAAHYRIVATGGVVVRQLPLTTSPQLITLPRGKGRWCE
jgi:hypothetical protein